MKGLQSRKLSLILILCAAFCALWCGGCVRHKRVQGNAAVRVDLRALRQETAEAMRGRTGAAVVIDTRSGRVLAMHNPETAVGRSFPVGSALKPLAAVAALQQGAAGPHLMLPCKGVTALHGSEYPCWLHGGHGSLAMEQALAQSCNIYFYTLGARMNGSKLAALARRFGFGKATGLSLARYTFKEDPGRVPDTFTPELVSRFAVGDTPEFRATPLQMAVFAAALANGGSMYNTKWAVRETYTVSAWPDADPVREIKSAKALATARRGMAQCVSSVLGTCHVLANMGFPAAGKTGTARHASGLRTHAWFIGFTPVDEPEAAVVVFLEQGEGARDAAPVARRIMQAWHQCKIY